MRNGLWWQLARWVPRIATVGLLIAAAALVGLWARSYHTADRWWLTARGHQYTATAHEGRLLLTDRTRTGHIKAESATAAFFHLQGNGLAGILDEAYGSRTAIPGTGVTVRHTTREGAIAFRFMNAWPAADPRTGVGWDELRFDDGHALAEWDRRTMAPLDDKDIRNIDDPRLHRAVFPMYYVSVTRRLAFPIGWPAALAAVLPAVRGLWSARRWWRRRRVPPGHCRRCGYDLRASPGRCPECGAIEVRHAYQGISPSPAGVPALAGHG